MLPDELPKLKERSMETTPYLALKLPYGIWNARCRMAED